MGSEVVQWFGKADLWLRTHSFRPGRRQDTRSFADGTECPVCETFADDRVLRLDHLLAPKTIRISRTQGLPRPWG